MAAATPKPTRRGGAAADATAETITLPAPACKLTSPNLNVRYMPLALNFTPATNLTVPAAVPAMAATGPFNCLHVDPSVRMPFKRDRRFARWLVKVSVESPHK